MSKHTGCLTATQVGNLESKRADKIMRKYGVPPDERKEITSIIKEGYFELHQSFEAQREFGRFLKEEHGIDTESEETGKEFLNWIKRQIKCPLINEFFKT